MNPLDKWQTTFVARSRLFVRWILKETLRHPSHFDWTLQGFGMFRLYLSRETRLHIWHSAFATPNVTTIHTHPWDFVSEILSGNIVDKVYTKVPDRIATHRETRIVCGQGGGPTGEFPQLVHLSLVSAEMLNAGASYSRLADDIHESVPSDGAITLVTRKFRADPDHAYVYPEADKNWISAEPKPASIGDVLGMAARALKELNA